MKYSFLIADLKEFNDLFLNFNVELNKVNKQFEEALGQIVDQLEMLDFYKVSEKLLKYFNDKSQEQYLRLIKQILIKDTYSLANIAYDMQEQPGMKTYIFDQVIGNAYENLKKIKNINVKTPSQIKINFQYSRKADIANAISSYKKQLVEITQHYVNKAKKLEKPLTPFLQNLVASMAKYNMTYFDGMKNVYEVWFDKKRNEMEHATSQTADATLATNKVNAKIGNVATESAVKATSTATTVVDEYEAHKDEIANASYIILDLDKLYEYAARYVEEEILYYQENLYPNRLDIETLHSKSDSTLKDPKYIFHICNLHDLSLSEDEQHCIATAYFIVSYCYNIEYDFDNVFSDFRDIGNDSIVHGVFIGILEECLKRANIAESSDRLVPYFEELLNEFWMDESRNCRSFNKYDLVQKNFGTFEIRNN